MDAASGSRCMVWNLAVYLLYIYITPNIPRRDEICPSGIRDSRLRPRNNYPQSVRPPDRADGECLSK